jgi:hypothetical protein
MTIDELKAAIAEKEAKSAELRAAIQANTDAARKLNDHNRKLMAERHAVEQEKRQLEHDLKKAEKAE